MTCPRACDALQKFKADFDASVVYGINGVLPEHLGVKLSTVDFYITGSLKQDLVSGSMGLLLVEKSESAGLGFLGRVGGRFTHCDSNSATLLEFHVDSSAHNQLNTNCFARAEERITRFS